jgi:hypothetical protein
VERAHVNASQKVLGKKAVRKPSCNFRGVTEDPDKFLKTAAAFEDLAVGANKGQAPRVKTRALLAAAVEVHSVEARHVVVARPRKTGRGKPRFTG